MSRRDTEKAKQPSNRPPAVECPHCHEYYTITGPAATYHQTAKCVQS